MTQNILIGMGCNLGDRVARLSQAAALLRAEVAEMTLSSLYESPALLPENALPEWNLPYLNLVLRGCTTLEPLPLLHFLKSIEQAMGRRERGYWAPREIDLDLLIYEGVAMQTPELTLPHPQMHLRDFVLIPMAEIISGGGLEKRGDLCLSL